MEKKFDGKVSTFLNRLLGLPVATQTLLFSYFTECFEAVVAIKKSEGKFDDGVVTLSAESVTYVPGFPREAGSPHLTH